MSLLAAQTLFHAVLAGEVPADDPRVAATFVGDARLSAAQRLEIYGDMFVGRQVEALQAEFPMVLALLGECAFADLAQGYLRAHPSEHPDIGQLGRELHAFIAGHPGVRGDLAELAALERARSLAFSAADVEPATWEQVAALGPEGFASVRLRFAPAVRTLQAMHDLGALWKALQAGEQPAPARLEAPRAFAIWKQGFEVLHAPLSVPEAAALDLARRGRPLGEVCEPFAAEPEPAAAAFEALASWFGDGWIAGLEA